MKSTYNQGQYASETIAKQWIAWIEDLKDDVLREQYIYPWLARWVAANKPEKILEIGSGQGACSVQLGKSDLTYIGVEPSLHLRKRAHELYPEQTFMEGKAEDIPLADASVEAAFSVFVWFHLADLQKPSSELARVLKPGGSFAIVTANPEAYERWLSWQKDVVQTGKHVRGSFKRFADHEMYLHHLEEITSALESSGLTIEEVLPCGDSDNQERRNGVTSAIIISGRK